GFIGSYGNRYANFAVANSDLLLVLGSRLDERQTGPDKTLFARKARIIHVDVDSDELNHNICEAISVCCDVESFLKEALAAVGGRTSDHKKWLAQIHRWKVQYPSCLAHDQACGVDPNEFLHILSRKVSGKAVICADVGQNLMWVAQSFCLSGGKQLLSSSGHGAMGYSLPAGIGAHCASPNRQIICVMGDGGIQMNLQELQTVFRERIPLKIFVMNNQSLGLIRTYQEKYFNDRCYGSVHGYANPDFEKLAYAFDILYTKICTREDFDGLDRGLEIEKPHLFEVVLSPKTQVVPEPAPRGPVEDQLPLLDRKELSRLFNMDDPVSKDEKI
ncbi:MAG: thiamine pyrophosphate-binding protein, partial [Smithella sp.]|nr:thiamine pyrophosphate-binding protein [Smithella sp.]